MVDTAPSVPLVILRARSAGHRAAGQGGQGRRPLLYRLPQPGRGRAGRPDPREAVSDVTRQTTARRQIVAGNSAYRRYLKTPAEQHFTNIEDRIKRGCPLRRALYLTHQHPDASAERDAPLPRFARGGAVVLRTKPCWRPGRSSPDRRGDPRLYFCSFLALVLRGELRNGWPPHGRSPSGVNCSPISTGYRKSRPSRTGSAILRRTPVTGVTGKLFQAVGVALPPNIRDADPTPAPP